MPNDAKLGMVVGVGLVIAIAVVFSRKDKVTTLDATPQAAAVEVVRANAGKAPVVRGQFRQAKARPATLTKEREGTDEPAASEHEPAENPNTP